MSRPNANEAKEDDSSSSVTTDNALSPEAEKVLSLLSSLGNGGEPAATPEEMKLADQLVDKAYKSLRDYVADAGSRVASKPDEGGRGQADRSCWFDVEEFEGMTMKPFFAMHGCFSCHKHSEGLLKCSKCRLAQYCNVDCQRKDWKQCHSPKSEVRGCWHLRNNIKTKLPPIINLACIGVCSPAMLSFTIKDIRRKAFLKLLDRVRKAQQPAADATDSNAAKDGNGKEMAPLTTYLSMVASAVERFGTIRLNGNIRMIIDFHIIDIQYILLDTIDDCSDPNSLRMLDEPPSGRLTAGAKENAFKLIEEFAVDAKRAGAELTQITLGQGLTNEKETLERRLNDVGCQVCCMVALEHAMR